MQSTLRPRHTNPIPDRWDYPDDVEKKARMAHRCGWCERPFYGHPQRRYCSADCRRRAKATRDTARGLWRTKPPGGHRLGCVECGEPFTADRIDARYCSAACRQRAYRRRVTGG